MENKITEEELKTIQEQQQKTQDILLDLGFFETRKHALLHELADLNKKIDVTKAELENEYGQVNINVADGTYTELEKDNSEEEVAVSHV